MRSENRISHSEHLAASAAVRDVGVMRGVATPRGPERAIVSPAARSGYVRVRLGAGNGRLGWTIHLPQGAV